VTTPSKRKSRRLEIDAPHTKRLRTIRAIEDQSIIDELRQKGNVGTLPQGYIRNVPLPRVPKGQSAKSRTQVHTIPGYYATPYVVPTYVNPRSIVESATYAFSPAWHAIAINT
jgi:hypothetical protein